MAETVAINRPSVAKAAVSRRRIYQARERVGVGAAPRCSRAYIGKLEAEGVVQRQGDGFPLDREPRCLLAIADKNGEPPLDEQ